MSNNNKTIKEIQQEITAYQKAIAEAAATGYEQWRQIQEKLSASDSIVKVVEAK